jgi:hypothetical protein
MPVFSGMDDKKISTYIKSAPGVVYDYPRVDLYDFVSLL